MTDNEKRSRKVKIKTVIRTVNQQVAMYKDYSKDVMKLCNFEDVEQQQQNLNEVLNMQIISPVYLRQVKIERSK